MSIEIIKEKENTKRKHDPYYTLTYNYMIGDANGDTSETVKVSVDNPYVERYVSLLNKLEPTPGHWGVMLEEGRIYDHLKDGQITEEEYYFLCRMMFEEFIPEEGEDDKVFVVPEEYEKFANEFCYGVRAETEYSFLVFEGVDLIYVDEFGKKHKTKIK